MRKLVIESGATKSEWCFIDDNKVNRLTAIGWNATSSKENLVINAQQQSWINECDKIYFYGAGVSSDLAINRTQSQFGLHKQVEAKSDLVASCLATLGNNTGIAGILGTGSISCIWDGKNTLVKTPSLGYLLSDEGSGSDLGKEVVKAYFYNKMPAELAEHFSFDYNLTSSSLIDQLYSSQSPKSYLANFSRFLTNHPHEWCDALVRERLCLFFDTRIKPIFQNNVQNIGFVGSIAFVFKDFLIDICNNLEIKNLTIYPSAMEGIIKYHQLYE